MTDEQREREIRERVERATPGPWRLGWPVCVCTLEHAHDGTSCDYRITEWFDGHVDGYSPVYVDAPFGAPPVEIADNEKGGLRTPDADFIAHAREDVPWLLARLDEARRERDGGCMMTDAERCLRDWAEGRSGPGTTHWEDCGVVHPACAALAVLRELDAVRRENERLRAERAAAAGSVNVTDEDRQQADRVLDALRDCDWRGASDDERREVVAVLVAEARAQGRPEGRG